MGEVFGLPRKPRGDAIPMSSADSHIALGRLYGLHELLTAIDEGNFSSLDELRAALWTHVDAMQQHLMCAGVAVEWCKCGAIGGTPCIACLGGRAPFKNIPD